jgi:hypothetical protein
MSNREIATELPQKLPENVLLHEIAREIEFIAMCARGLNNWNEAKEFLPRKSDKNSLMDSKQSFFPPKRSAS